MGFSRQEYWNGLPCPPLEDLPNPGIEPVSLTSPELAGGFFITSITWEALTRILFVFLRLTQHCKSTILQSGASQVTLVVKSLPANAGDIRDNG